MSDFAVIPYLQVLAPSELCVQLDKIFFTASATQAFESRAARAAFRERWFSRYLVNDAAHAFLLIDARAQAVGYLVGSLEDPARIARFADLASVRIFETLSASFPAHLHINLAAHVRDQGLGQRLVEAFAAHAVACGAHGVHVVTGARSRNVNFYRRCGFVEVGAHTSGTSDMVFLGRSLI